jgi:hypothetical protein
MQLDLLLLLNEILFINFEVLKRTEKIKKRGEECFLPHRELLYAELHYPPGINPATSDKVRPGP